MPPHAYFLTKFGTDTSAPRWPFGLNLLAFCLNSGFFVWRSGPPAAGVGLRENCHLGAFFFPRASLFSTFLRTLARSSRAFLFVIVLFRVGRPFSCFPPSIFMFAQHALGRPQDRLSAASSRASRVLQGAACPPSLAELIFCLHSVACLSSIGPTFLFRMFFRFSRRRLESVCVCVSSFSGVGVGLGVAAGLLGSV